MISYVFDPYTKRHVIHDGEKFIYLWFKSSWNWWLNGHCHILLVWAAFLLLFFFLRKMRLWFFKNFQNSFFSCAYILFIINKICRNQKFKFYFICVNEKNCKRKPKISPVFFFLIPNNELNIWNGFKFFFELFLVSKKMKNSTKNYFANIFIKIFPKLIFRKQTHFKRLSILFMIQNGNNIKIIHFCCNFIIFYFL